MELAETPSLLDLPAYELSDAEKRFFHTFGFLRIDQLFRDQIEEITARFEATFAAESDAERLWKIEGSLEGGEPRFAVPGLLELDPWLGELAKSRRVNSIIEGLMGSNYEYTNSDGNLMYCSTTWHPDTYGSPLDRFHLKCCMYLDPLDADTGALRVIPGSHFWDETYATGLRTVFHDPNSVESTLGAGPEDLPAHTIDTQPGDLILWSYRTLHATFHGVPRRRLISMGFRAVEPTSS